MLFDDIVDHRSDGKEIMQQDALVISNNLSKGLRNTTKGWEILIKWKYRTTTWESMKDVKECYPLKLVEYYHQI